MCRQAAADTLHTYDDNIYIKGSKGPSRSLTGGLGALVKEHVLFFLVDWRWRQQMSKCEQLCNSSALTTRPFPPSACHACSRTRRNSLTPQGGGSRLVPVPTSPKLTCAAGKLQFLCAPGSKPAVPKMEMAYLDTKVTNLTCLRVICAHKA